MASTVTDALALAGVTVSADEMGAVAALFSRAGLSSAARYEPAQSASAAVLVAPTSAGLFADDPDAESSEDDEGDGDGDDAKKEGAAASPEDAAARLKTARGEFDALVAALRGAGVLTVVADPTAARREAGTGAAGAAAASSASAAATDDNGDGEEDDEEEEATHGVFVGDWVSTHNDADMLCVYSMRDAHRRAERYPGLVRLLQRRYSEIANFARFEVHREFLAASDLAMDRLNRVAYRCTTEQIPEMAVAWESLLGFVETERFMPVPGAPLRTDMLLSLGSKFVVFCGAAIGDDEKHRRLLDCFSETEKSVIDITIEQACSFCANVIEMRTPATANAPSQTFVVMSTTAHEAFTKEQLDELRSFVDKDHVVVDVSTLEKYGGASVGAMICPVF